ncbi:TRAP transporter small permease [Jiella pelagia]|uniref:TRAP transporter small permease protein n=1 Tax=Jiella pelagia TaxID=2986949 RepID=A0ABY7BTF6_9HYPH|nr:TRAP transporter small permease [Jiella pelagia]WAP66768.1 TRAP transporter small permease [Jiella pelagia]
MIASDKPFWRRVADKAELVVSGAAFVVMLAVIVANVFMRYLFSQSVLSAEEVAYMGFTWSIFAAVAWLYRTRALIAVDLFFSLFPYGAQRVLAVAVNFLLLVANLWFCWLAWVLASGGWIRKTPVLEVPYFWINLAPLLAFGLMAIYSAVHMIEDVRNPAFRDPNHDHEAEMSRDTAL